MLNPNKSLSQPSEKARVNILSNFFSRTKSFYFPFLSRLHGNHNLENLSVIFFLMKVEYCYNCSPSRLENVSKNAKEREPMHFIFSYFSGVISSTLSINICGYWTRRPISIIRLWFFIATLSNILHYIIKKLEPLWQIYLHS